MISFPWLLWKMAGKQVLLMLLCRVASDKAGHVPGEQGQLVSEAQGRGRRRCDNPRAVELGEGCRGATGHEVQVLYSGA